MIFNKHIRKNIFGLQKILQIEFYIEKYGHLKFMNIFTGYISFIYFVNFLDYINISLNYFSINNIFY